VEIIENIAPELIPALTLPNGHGVDTEKQNIGRELKVPENSIISAADYVSVEISTDRHTFSWTPNPMGQVTSCNIR